MPFLGERNIFSHRGGSVANENTNINRSGSASSWNHNEVALSEIVSNCNHSLFFEQNMESGEISLVFLLFLSQYKNLMEKSIEAIDLIFDDSEPTNNDSKSINNRNHNNNNSPENRELLVTEYGELYQSLFNFIRDFLSIQNYLSNTEMPPDDNTNNNNDDDYNWYSHGNNHNRSNNSSAFQEDEEVNYILEENKKECLSHRERVLLLMECRYLNEKRMKISEQVHRHNRTVKEMERGRLLDEQSDIEKELRKLRHDADAPGSKKAYAAGGRVDGSSDGSADDGSAPALRPDQTRRAGEASPSAHSGGGGGGGGLDHASLHERVEESLLYCYPAAACRIDEEDDTNVDGGDEEEDGGKAFPRRVNTSASSPGKMKGGNNHHHPGKTVPSHQLCTSDEECSPERRVAQLEKVIHLMSSRLLEENIRLNRDQMLALSNDYIRYLERTSTLFATISHLKTKMFTDEVTLIVGLHSHLYAQTENPRGNNKQFTFPTSLHLKPLI